MAIEDKPEFLAAEAERLSKDRVLNYAIDAMRKDAVDRLIYCNPGDHIEVARLQAICTNAEGLLDSLESFILAHRADDPSLYEDQG